jgi:hypothetical protein
MQTSSAIFIVMPIVMTLFLFFMCSLPLLVDSRDVKQLHRSEAAARQRPAIHSGPAEAGSEPGAVGSPAPAPPDAAR